MGQDFARLPPKDASQFKPITVLVNRTPDAVCVLLLRHALESAAAPAGQARWSAQRQDGSAVVDYYLQEGPLSYLHLRFSAEADGPAASVLWVIGEYAPKRSRLSGAFERWRTQRDALALRENVLQLLKGPALVGPDQAVQPAQQVRAAVRFTVRAPARLFVGTRTWHAEVIDVSETGLSLLAATVPSKAADDAELFLEEETGEVEVLLPGERNRVRVRIRRARPSRGGVEVGVQVIDVEGIMSLLKRAIAQGKPDGG